MSDEISGLDHRFGLRDEKIKELEKKIDAIHDTHMIKYEQWADKLTAWVEDIDILKKWNEKAKIILGRVLSKLFKRVFTLNHNALINTRLTKEQIEKETKAFIKIINDSKHNREILRELGTECKEAIDLISKDEWDRDTRGNLRTHRDNIKRTLKKLDGSQEKTEKKEDSEALKKIKELAKEESEFYDKHGYFSFWSDGLKAQRIKDLTKEDSGNGKSVPKSEEAICKADMEFMDRKVSTDSDKPEPKSYSREYAKCNNHKCTGLVIESDCEGCEEYEERLK